MLTTTINSGSGNVTIASTTLAVDVTFRIDLTGSATILFDQFWIQMQRAGVGTSNTVGSTASYSTDGTNFTSSLTVSEVAQGANNVANGGDYSSFTSFRTPDGFGGTIGPQQVYRIAGLSAAGNLNSGSLYIRYTVGSTNSAGALNLASDRVDLNTTSVAFSTTNDPGTATSTNGLDDGYDILWTGTIIPEPSAALLGAFGMLALLRRRR